jgi:hypothetical protein
MEAFRNTATEGGTAVSMTKLIALVALLALMTVCIPPAVAKDDRNEGESVSLYTAPMILEGTRSLVCSIVNVSKQTRTVTILPGFGAPQQLAPGQSAVLSSEGQPGCTDGGCPAYCVFSVQGGKHNFRASACIYTGDDPLVCLPAE